MPTSGNVDERIVEMRIDHDKFEQGAKKTIDILEKLDEGLKSLGKKQTDGFDDVASSLDKVTNKISVFGTIGDQIIRNLTSQAMDLVRQFNHMVDSLTIDQVSAGWSKYAQKTQGVQTIMAATAKDWEDQGAQMEYVNAQLEKLNWFTDETSYNLLDMVNNIGKFTSAGVDLETAVTAMQGIATWAGISGANTQEASRAMYNLSQALGVGAVTQMDWKSIENANMATYEFKQIVLETAAAMGKLEKVKDGVFKTDYTNKSGEIHEVTVESFRQYLSDKWFDSDVLMAALEQYGGFTDLLYEVSDATKLTATQILQQIELYEKDGKVISKLVPYIKDLTSAEYELGRRAFRAAQEAKTFQEAIDATKDAVSTAWMNVFETMFGDYLKAKELWTSVAESLYTIFADPVNRLWEIFDQAFNGPNPLRDSLAEAGYTMSDLEEAAKSTIEELSSSKDYNDVFRADALQKLIDKYGSLEGAIKAGAVSASMFSMILDQMNRNTIDDILLGKNTHFNDVLTDLRQNAMWFMNGAIDEQTLIARGYNMDMIRYWVAAYEKAKKSGKEDDDITPYTDEFMEKFYDDLLKLAGYTDEEIEAFKELGLTVNQVLESMTDPMVTRTEGFKLFADSLLNLLTVVENIGNAISSAFSVIFGGGTGDDADDIANSNAAEGLYQLIERFHNFTESLVLTEDEMNTLRDRFVSFFESIGSVRGIFDIIGAVLSGIWNIVLKIFGAISDSKLLPTLLNAALILLQALAIPLGLIVSGISALINKGQELSKQEWAQRLTGWFTQLGTKILDAANRFKTFMESSEVAAWLTSTLDKIVSFLSPLIDGFSNAIKKIQYFWKVLKQVFKLSGFSGVLKWLGANISAKLSLIFEDLKKKFSKENIKAAFNNIITSISNFFTSNTSLGAIGTAIKTFFSNIFEKIYTFISSKIDISKLSPAWESIKNFFIGIFNSVSSFLTGKFNFKGFGDAFTSIWEFIKNIASKVKNFVSSKFSFENIGDTLKSFIRVLSDLVREAMPLIRTGLVIYVLTSIIQWSRALRWLVETPSEFAEGFKIAAIAGMIASIALLVIALAGAVKWLSTLSPGELATGLTGLTAIAAILLGFIAALVLIEKRLDTFGSLVTELDTKATGFLKGSFSKKFSVSGLWNIIPVILAIAALVGAVAILGKMDFGQLVQGIVSLTVLLTELLGFIVFSSLFIRLAGPALKSIMGVAVGIWLLASAMKKLGDMDIKQMLKGILGIHLIVSELQRFAITSLFMDPWGMQGLIYAAGAVWIIALSLRGLATMKIEAMLKGVIGLHLIVGELIRFTRRGRQIQDGKQLFGLIGVALTVLVLVGSLKALSTMSFAEIFKSWIALFLLIGQLIRVMRRSIMGGGIFGILGKRTSINSKAFFGLIAIAVAVAGLAAVMVALGKVPAKQLAKGFLALAGIMTTLSIFIRSTRGAFGGKAFRSIISALAIIGVVAGSAYILKKLAEVPGDKLVGAAASLSAVLLGIAGAMVLISRFGGGFKLGPILMLGAGVAALWFVANKILVPLGESNVDFKRAGEIALIALGTLLGIAAIAFIIGKVPAGPAVSGIAKIGLILGAIEVVVLILIGIGIAIVAAAIELAKKLSTFMTELNPFLESIKTIDASTVENVGRFAEVMGLLMLAEVFTAVASALANIPSDALFKDLNNLGKSVVTFATDISSLKPEDITSIQNFNSVMLAICEITALEALGELFAFIAEKIPGDADSLLDNLASLAEELTKEGGFLSKLGDIDEGQIAKVQNFAEVMKALAGVEAWAVLGTMLQTLGNVFSKISNKLGFKESFAESIVTLYEGVRKVIDGLRGVDEKGNYDDEKAIGSNALKKIKNFVSIAQELTKITGWHTLSRMLTAMGNNTDVTTEDISKNLLGLIDIARDFSDAIKKKNIGGGTTEKIKNFAEIMNAIGMITVWDTISSMLTALKSNVVGDTDYSATLSKLPEMVSKFAEEIDKEDIPTDTTITDKVNAFADIMQALTKVTAWSVLNDIISTLSPYAGKEGDIKSAMDALANWTEKFPTFLHNISLLGNDANPANVETFASMMASLTGITTWTIIDDIISTWSPYAGKEGDIKSAMDALANWTENFPTFLHNISLLGDDANPANVATFASMMSSLTRITTWSVVTDIISKLSPYANDSSKNAMVALANFTESLPDFLTNISSVDESAVANVEAFIGLLKALAGLNIGITARGIADDVVGAAGDIVHGITNPGETISNAWKGIKSLFGGDNGETEDIDPEDNMFTEILGVLESFYINITSMDIDINQAAEVLGRTADLIYSFLSLRAVLAEDSSFNPEEISTSLVSMVTSALTTVASDGSIMAKAWTVGFNVVSGIASGVADNLLAAYNAGVTAGNAVERGFTDATQIASPSRVFMALAEYIPTGIAKGIENNSGEAIDSITILSSGVLAALQMAMANVATIADSDFDISPRITPVVDMSNVEFAAGNTGRMFGSVGTAVRGSMRLAMDTMQASNNPRDNGSGNIVNEIRTMSSKLDTLESAVSSMQIVLDTGTLVGSTSKKMDAALGTAQARKSRAN